MRAGGLGGALDKGKIATRRAYGAALVAAGQLIPQVAVLDADVSNSTFTEMFRVALRRAIHRVQDRRAERDLDGRWNVGRRLDSVREQLRQVHLARLRSGRVGEHFARKSEDRRIARRRSPCSDGPSQMGLVDTAFFRAFTNVRGDDRQQPLCWTFNPADAVAAYQFTRLMTQINGLCYMRTYRPDVPLLYKPDATFEPGGCALLSSGEDVAIVSAGYMLGPAREAISALGKQGVRAALIDCYSLPIQEEKLAELLARCGGKALVVEDNYAGGLGAAVAEVAARRGTVRVESLICQRYPKSTRTPEEELDYLGLSPNHIADHAMSLLRKPN